MSELPSSSFIPKRGPSQKTSIRRRNNPVLFSAISYALFIAAPLAAAAVFIYERHTQNQFDKAIVALDEAIVGFKEADMERVVNFNERLMLSKKLLTSHVSIAKLFTTLESQTTQAVGFKNLSLVRTDDSLIKVSGNVTTVNFDSALFQRSAYQTNAAIKEPVFSNVKIVTPQSPDTSSSVNTIEFIADFGFAVNDVLYTPINSALEVTDVENDESSVSESVSASATSSTNI